MMKGTDGLNIEKACFKKGFQFNFETQQACGCSIVCPLLSYYTRVLVFVEV